MAQRFLIVTLIALSNAFTALSAHSHRHAHFHHSDIFPRSSVDLNATCSQQNDCPSGECCSDAGLCGLTRAFCGEGCISNCNQDPPPTNATEVRLLAVEDDPYSCAPGKPCRNGACCGESGFCGYGPTYCGTGCTSNCNATAQCGKFAAVPGKKCPLNTCCSQHGFCGTTGEFCNDGCQSNCVEHPKPPGTAGGKVLDRVIGYWEAWNARSTCHNTQAIDLPLEGLTHVNYAFAYIDPASFEITTMDAKTPVSTFQDAVDLKLFKPDLKVFLSIGGWTFSDNGTATQPVFGNIARSASNRLKFANNLLKFMNGYGYDGVDFDWEYPGAPDRGGKEDDTVNYVELLKTVRSVFDKSGRELEITYTAPSSYWYLRWFDLPGMDKYVDWVNLMSYDLHGVWDSDNPIGSIVQGHTNLTEIKTASELFWRVGISPSKIALGFGFYGRAFTLADPSCITPGCPFRGGAKKGVCTKTSGYLAHYEIQDILKNSKKRDLTVYHDKAAAVKYITWDNDQWISFDDADSFDQKKKWANDIGFSGSLIWASDLDDYENTAHKQFTGNNNLGSRDSLLRDNKKNEFVETANAFLGEGCFFDKTVVQDVTQHDCGKGMELVGYDAHGCREDKNHKGKACGWPMCCPKTARMKDKCQWRGDGPECNGQCHANEVTIGGSSWGGLPGEGDTTQCNRGGKALCCAVELDAITNGCYWTEGCDNQPCQDDEESVAHAYNIRGGCTGHDEFRRRDNGLFGLESRATNTGQNYCCKKVKKPFDKCRWVGDGDCAHNTCGRDEVGVATNDYGDKDYPCNWWRKRALCCTPNEDALNTPICDANLCDMDRELCGEPQGDDELGDLVERAASPPGASKEITLKLASFAGAAVYKMVVYTPPYPSGYGQLFKKGLGGLKTLPLEGGYMMQSAVCTSLGVTAVAYNKMKKSLKHYNGGPTIWNTEHFFEHNTIERRLTAAVTGILPSGKRMVTKALDPKRLIDAWDSLYPPGATIHPLGEAFVEGRKGFGTPDAFGIDWNILNTPGKRFMTTYGSWAYRYPLTYLPADMNVIKSNLLMGKYPVSKDKLKVQLDLAASASEAARDAANQLMTALQRTYGAVNYFNDGYLADHFDKVTRDAYLTARDMGRYWEGLENFEAILREWDVDYLETATANARRFMGFVLGKIMERFKGHDPALSPQHIRDLLAAADFFARKEIMRTLRFTPYGS